MTLVDVECFPQQKVSASSLESFVWQSSGTEADARKYGQYIKTEVSSGL